MTTWDKMRKAIRNDATLQHIYFAPREDGGMDACVIGGLALAAGLDYAETYDDFNMDSIGTLDDFVHSLITAYPGVSREALCLLQTVNDRCEETEPRRCALLLTVDKLEAGIPLPAWVYGKANEEMQELVHSIVEQTGVVT